MSCVSMTDICSREERENYKAASTLGTMMRQSSRAERRDLHELRLYDGFLFPRGARELQGGFNLGNYDAAVVPRGATGPPCVAAPCAGTVTLDRWKINVHAKSLEKY
jgi:hypothetical protein